MDHLNKPQMEGTSTNDQEIIQVSCALKLLTGSLLILLTGA